MGKRLLTASVTAVALGFLVAPGAFAQTGISLGETTILSNEDDGNRGSLVAQRATLDQPATLQSLSFYVTRADGLLRLGVYDASGPGGGPGTKKGETSAFAPGLGWNTRPVTTPVLLPAGTYWLAFAPSSSRLAFRRELTGTARSYRRSFGVLPATFSRRPKVEGAHWSLYATLTSSSGGTVTVSLSADPPTVESGATTTLTWSSANATSCAASTVGTEGSPWSGTKPTSGSEVRGPLTVTATYSLTCTGAGGAASASLTIPVTAAPAPTVSLTAYPATIVPGESTVLRWSSTDTVSCTASGGWSGAQPPSGELVVLTASTATYTLSCTGAGGSATQSVTVTVAEGPALLTLTWVDNAGGGAIFRIERRTGSSGAYVQIASTGAGAVEYVDATPVRGTMYCYRVRASNDHGDSPYSNEACGTP